ncbi:unnamed protein product, partial [Wuchereria bancrofti]
GRGGWGDRGGRGGWGDRGGRGSWGGRGRSGRGRSDQGRKGFSTKNEGDLDFKKRMSFDIDNRSEKSGGKKNENKYKKSMSEPSTPVVKFKKYEMDSEHDEDEEMSTSDIEDQAISKFCRLDSPNTELKVTSGTFKKTQTFLSAPKTPKKIADMTSKQEKIFTSKSCSGLVQSAEGLPRKKGALKRENGKEKDGELVISRDVKKARILNVESDKDNGEESDYDEDEEESSDEGSEGEVVKKNLNGVAETSESDEDEESLEDEDEEETPSEVKPILTFTPGNIVPLKSALKTPGTGKSSKKVSLSAITTTTPEMLLKNKTPATPHPQTMSSKNKRRLKFEESDESYEDEEDDDEKDEGRFKLDNREMKMVENDDSEGEEMTDEDEEESNESEGEDNTKRRELAKAKHEGTVEAIQNKKDKINLKKLHNKNDKGTEEKLASQKQAKAIADKDETKGVKRKCEDGPLLKPEDAKDVIKEEQKRRDERDKKSLFVRGLPKDVKLGQLKALHNDILYVRHMPHRNFAWLIFASEKLCEKAYEDISKQTVEGRTLTVDFCGSKAKTRPQKDRSQLPINPLELFVGGLPPSTSKDQMKVIFRQATSISF